MRLGLQGSKGRHGCIYLHPIAFCKVKDSCPLHQTDSNGNQRRTVRKADPLANPLRNAHYDLDE